MLFILFFSYLANAHKKNEELSKLNKENKQNLKYINNKKKNLSKNLNKRQENSANITKFDKKNRDIKRKARKKIGDQDSMQEIANDLQKLKDGVEIYKAMYRNNNRNYQPMPTNQRNKMFDILDQIRERYAPPTTPVSHITFSSIFITFVVIALIIVIAYLMISRYFKIKSSEINEEELPLIIGQINQDQHDLSVHGFSKI